MTLILTATCKNGIVICADKRRTLKSDVGTRYIDDLNKVFRFPRLGCVGFNHGINHICGITWEEYFRMFEANHLGDEILFDSVVDRFRDFMMVPVQQEFLRNRFDDSIGYVFAAWVASGHPMVRELFWKRGCALEDKRHSGLIRSGNGKSYLDQFLKENPTFNSTEYWTSMDVAEGMKQLQRLASIAAQEKHRVGGCEFSDEFSCGILNGQPAM